MDGTLLITGGTGSFGNAVLRRFLQSDLREIRIFSRDEKKQDDMRKLYANPRLKFYLGDVRDYTSVLTACRPASFTRCRPSRPTSSARRTCSRQPSRTGCGA
jgi:UDP-glucose 4-epimerase